MLVKEIMTSPSITVRTDTPVPEVARLMQERDIGAVVVVDEGGRLCGIITESDFTGIGRCVPFSPDLAPVVFGARAATLEELGRIYDMARKLKAKDVMSERVETLEASDDVGSAVHRMLTHNLKHLPVVRDGPPVGMVARHDVLKLLRSGLSR
ncbi:MAG: CBS domain-containing protein [Candidatus Rokubacteria bacterium]|nr:CBS domain-containing protein [Candidatus Rokubacteria bacterium]